jgi:multimeric flavodoxin WrbA
MYLLWWKNEEETYEDRRIQRQSKRFSERNRCIYQDDMQDVMSHFKDLDILMLGTPLYFDNVSGMLKVFLDRCIAYGSYFIEADETGESKHIDAFSKKHEGRQAPGLVVISNRFPSDRTGKN